MVRKWIGCHLMGMLAAVVIPASAAAAELQLTVSVPHPGADGGVATNRIRLGVHPGASNDFDPALDLEAFPSPGLTAAIRHPEYPPAQQLLWWDFRSDALPQVWELEVVSDRPNANISINRASPSSSQSGCAQASWMLRDVLSSQSVELALGAITYTYPNTPGVVRRFVVTAMESIAMPPPAPVNLWSPRQGRATVYLAWSGVGDATVRYHVYRETERGTQRLTTTPLTTTTYADVGVDRSLASTYRVTAITQGGCEGAPSAGMTIAPRS